MRILIILAFYYLILLYAHPPIEKHPLPINIGLAVDEKSARDLLIVINSALISAYDKENIVFHIVACGSDMNEANILVNNIKASIANCFPSTLQTQIIPFTLPRDSGFYLQMVNAKHKSHWSSSTGADMARFYFSSLFPTLYRILYVDNDALITCCLEEIWATPMTANQVLGVALDDLKWATTTQFHRQYNASHPLVAKNIRRSISDIHQPVTQEEFWKALPRYPNDGVLLIDVQKFNHMKILQTIDEIAMANGHGEYVVGLGTQQFTVLGMHDLWVELTPRANLRHFPDMARGYLMWFLYNGLIHYAGAAKPRQLCSLEGKVENEHRLRTYVPWATTVLELQERCPSEKSIQADNCWQHIPSPKNRMQFLDLVDKMVQVTRDPSLVYLKIGKDFSGSDMSYVSYKSSLACFPHIMENALISSPTMPDNQPAICQSDLISIVDRFVLHNSSWSARMYHRLNESVTSTQQYLSSIKYTRHVDIRTSYLHDIKRRPTKKHPSGSREWIASALNYCSYISPIMPGYPPTKQNVDCTMILDDIKSNGKKHWDVVAISIDVLYNVAERAETSLSALRALDLEFIRAKFILVKLYSNTADTLTRDVNEAKAIIHRNGFVVYHDLKSDQVDGDKIMSTTVGGTFMSVFDFPVS